jgi:thiol-disulfide isomerase/thioredoxin/ribosomal protein L37E
MIESSRPDEQEQIACPRCGHVQGRATECAACGVVFAKLRTRPADDAPAHGNSSRPTGPKTLRPPPAAEQRPSVLGWLVPILLLATAGASLVRQEPPAEEPEPHGEIALAHEALARPADENALQAVPPAPALPISGAAPAAPAPPLEVSPPGAPQLEVTVAPEIPAAEQLLPARNLEVWYRGASGYGLAVAEATRHRAPVAVYVYTDWCPYCRDLESEVLSANPVRQYLRGLVKVMINPEDGAAEQGVADRFGVRGYPSFFVYSPSTGQTEKIHGRTPEDFIADCRRASGI